MITSIEKNYSNTNIRNSCQNELPHFSRSNYNNKKTKIKILPHSFSHNKILQYLQQNNCIPNIINSDKNLNYLYENDNDNSKKSENIHDTTFNNIIDFKDLMGNSTNKPIELKMLYEPMTVFNKGKLSSKSFGIITSYAANTNRGIVRNYNEDRVSIVINLNKPNKYKSSLPWPKISFFAIFDGHAGNKCVEYLRENLLKLICLNDFFPENIPQAINYGFEKADEIFLNDHAMEDGQLKDNSGTCGLILLIVNNEVYIGNVGDSRCLGSFNNGKMIRDITRDHKPNKPYEKERIIANGGQIYQTKTNIKIQEDGILKNKILVGPYRVLPGRLSVSRTIGDAEAKIPVLGGKPNVIISKPDIFKFDIKENDIDYFILGCDGIFDQLTSKDVFKCASLVLEKNKDLLEKIEKNLINLDEYKSLYGNNIDIHSTCGDIIDLILKASMIRQSCDNVTCLIICFKNLLNENYQIINDDIYDNNHNNNYNNYNTDIQNNSKKMKSSNSSNNFIKIKENKKRICKIMKKLRSGNSDTNLFNKKEDIVIGNEMKYTKKPMMNIHIKKYNKNIKEKSLTNMHQSQSNSNIKITLENNHSYSINHTYNFRDEKRNNCFNKINEDKEFQMIYKNINNNNILNYTDKINVINNNTRNNHCSKKYLKLKMLNNDSNLNNLYKDIIDGKNTLKKKNSLSLKKLFIKKEEENNKNNNENFFDTNTKNKINNTNIINDSKIKSKKAYHNLIKKKIHLNPIKNFDVIINNNIESDYGIFINDSKNSLNNNSIKHYDNDKYYNTNSSIHHPKKLKSLGIKKIFSTSKNILYPRENKKSEKKIIAEYNKQKNDYSNNIFTDKTNEQIKQSKIHKVKCNTFNVDNKIKDKSKNDNNESRDDEIKNSKELQLKIFTQLRINTEYNNKDKKF